MTEEKYHPVPQPEEISQKERDDAMGSYMMMFAALAVGLPLPILNLIASIIYYFTNRHVSRFVKFHCLQGLISQIPLTIINGTAVFWGIRIIASEDPTWSLNIYFKAYAGLVLFANLIYLIMGIVAAVKAYKGRMFYFWGFGALSYHQVFRVRDFSKEETVIVNTPPKF